MIEFIATSDVHGCLKNITPFKEAIKECLNQCIVNQCPLWIGGDLNDTKAMLRSEFCKFLIDIFKEHPDIPIYILVGNHDMNNHHEEEHSLEFLKEIPNVTVIDSPQFVFGSWYALPYRHKNTDILKDVEQAKKLGATRLLMHQGFLGANQSDYVIDESSISTEAVREFKIVLTGHYHNAQRVGGSNVYYFGSPFTVSFAEANQSKNIWLIRDGDLGITRNPIPMNIRKHVQIEFNEGINHAYESPNPHDIVKIIPKGSKEYCASFNKEEMKKNLGVENLVILPEIQTERVQRIDSSKINKPIEVIKEYLQKADTQLCKTDLSNYLERVKSESYQPTC